MSANAQQCLASETLEKGAVRLDKMSLKNNNNSACLRNHLNEEGCQIGLSERSENSVLARDTVQMHMPLL